MKTPNIITESLASPVQDDYDHSSLYGYEDGVVHYQFLQLPYDSHRSHTFSVCSRESYNIIMVLYDSLVCTVAQGLPVLVHLCS